jgi:hypothetical protein
MSTLSAILFGMALAWTPSLVWFAIRFWKELQRK